MNWWSVISKAPLNVAGAQKNLYEHRAKDFEGEYRPIYQELINFLESKVPDKIKDAKLNRADYWTFAVLDANLNEDLTQLVGVAKAGNVQFIKKLEEDLTQNFNSPTTARYQRIGKRWIFRIKNPKVEGQPEAEDSDVHVEPVSTTEERNVTRQPAEGWDDETPTSY